MHTANVYMCVSKDKNQMTHVQTSILGILTFKNRTNATQMSAWKKDCVLCHI